ncbi:hypothetical protein G7Y79_00024g055020 [Physcia stellaris]|nr:hypothetical protein G7Y79_00024g055020 [Physcia stellaris]
MTAIVEPNVSMDALVRRSLRYGLIPPVVPEFPDITVGGGFAGTAAESSSFKYGFLENTVNWIEIILADGSVTLASRDFKSDLYHGAAGTFGTLGVITLLEIQLVNAEAFVQLTYHPVNSMREVVAQVQKATEDHDNDFVDGILFKRDRGAVITGRFIKEPCPSLPVRSFTQARDEWYYLHVEQVLADTNTLKAEVVPIRDYLFRYDRGAFWAARYAFTYFAVPFTHFWRWALNSLMSTKILYHGLHENGMAQHNIIQDIVLPISRVEEFLEWIDENYAIYPLWLCPIRQSDEESFYPLMDGMMDEKKNERLSWEEKQPMPIRSAKPKDHEQDDLLQEQAIVPTHEKELLMSLGVWGPQLPDPDDFLAENRKLEHKVHELGGIKWLYAHCHYTQEEFWTIYNKQWYDELRAKYHATGLPSVYDKTRFDWDSERRAIQGSWLRWLFSFYWWIWPVPGIYGVLCVLMNSDYLAF